MSFRFGKSVRLFFAFISIVVLTLSIVGALPANQIYAADSTPTPQPDPNASANAPVDPNCAKQVIGATKRTVVPEGTKSKGELDLGDDFLSKNPEIDSDLQKLNLQQLAFLAGRSLPVRRGSQTSSHLIGEVHPIAQRIIELYAEKSAKAQGLAAPIPLNDAIEQIRTSKERPTDRQIRGTEKILHELEIQAKALVREGKISKLDNPDTAKPKFLQLNAEFFKRHNLSRPLSELSTAEELRDLAYMKIENLTYPASFGATGHPMVQDVEPLRSTIWKLVTEKLNRQNSSQNVDQFMNSQPSRTTRQGGIVLTSQVSLQTKALMEKIENAIKEDQNPPPPVPEAKLHLPESFLIYQHPEILIEIHDSVPDSLPQIAERVVPTPGHGNLKLIQIEPIRRLILKEVAKHLKVPEDSPKIPKFLSAPRNLFAIDPLIDRVAESLQHPKPSLEAFFVDANEVDKELMERSGLGGGLNSVTDLQLAALQRKEIRLNGSSKPITSNSAVKAAIERNAENYKTVMSRAGFTDFSEYLHSIEGKITDADEKFAEYFISKMWNVALKERADALGIPLDQLPKVDYVPVPNPAPKPNQTSTSSDIIKFNDDLLILRGPDVLEDISKMSVEDLMNLARQEVSVQGQTATRKVIDIDPFGEVIFQRAKKHFNDPNLSRERIREILLGGPATIPSFKRIQHALRVIQRLTQNPDQPGKANVYLRNEITMDLLVKYGLNTKLHDATNAQVQAVLATPVKNLESVVAPLSDPRSGELHVFDRKTGNLTISADDEKFANEFVNDLWASVVAERYIKAGLPNPGLPSTHLTPTTTTSTTSKSIVDLGEDILIVRGIDIMQQVSKLKFDELCVLANFEITSPQSLSGKRLRDVEPFRSFFIHQAKRLLPGNPTTADAEKKLGDHLLNAVAAVTQAIVKPVRDRIMDLLWNSGTGALPQTYLPEEASLDVLKKYELDKALSQMSDAERAAVTVTKVEVLGHGKCILSDRQVGSLYTYLARKPGTPMPRVTDADIQIANKFHEKLWDAILTERRERAGLPAANTSRLATTTTSTSKPIVDIGEDILIRRAPNILEEISKMNFNELSELAKFEVGVPGTNEQRSLLHIEPFASALVHQAEKFRPYQSRQQIEDILTFGGSSPAWPMTNEKNRISAAITDPKTLPNVDLLLSSDLTTQLLEEHHLADEFRNASNAQQFAIENLEVRVFGVSRPVPLKDSSVSELSKLMKHSTPSIRVTDADREFASLFMDKVWQAVFAERRKKAGLPATANPSVTTMVTTTPTSTATYQILAEDFLLLRHPELLDQIVHMHEEDLRALWMEHLQLLNSTTVGATRVKIIEVLSRALEKQMSNRHASFYSHQPSQLSAEARKAAKDFVNRIQSIIFTKAGSLSSVDPNPERVYVPGELAETLEKNPQILSEIDDFTLEELADLARVTFHYTDGTQSTCFPKLMEFILAREEKSYSIRQNLHQGSHKNLQNYFEFIQPRLAHQPRVTRLIDQIWMATLGRREDNAGVGILGSPGAYTKALIERARAGKNSSASNVGDPYGIDAQFFERHRVLGETFVKLPIPCFYFLNRSPDIVLTSVTNPDDKIPFLKHPVIKAEFERIHPGMYESLKLMTDWEYVYEVQASNFYEAVQKAIQEDLGRGPAPGPVTNKSPAPKTYAPDEHVIGAGEVDEYFHNRHPALLQALKGITTVQHLGALSKVFIPDDSNPDFPVNVSMTGFSFVQKALAENWKIPQSEIFKGAELDPVITPETMKAAEAVEAAFWKAIHDDRVEKENPKPINVQETIADVERLKQGAESELNSALSELSKTLLSPYEIALLSIQELEGSKLADVPEFRKIYDPQLQGISEELRERVYKGFGASKAGDIRENFDLWKKVVVNQKLVSLCDHDLKELETNWNAQPHSEEEAQKLMSIYAQVPTPKSSPEDTHEIDEMILGSAKATLALSPVTHKKPLSSEEKAKVEPAMEKFREVRESVNRTVFERSDLLDLVLISLLAKGHIHIEGLGGVAKTYLIEVLAKHIKWKDGKAYKLAQGSSGFDETDLYGSPDFASLEKEKDLKLLVEHGLFGRPIAVLDELSRLPKRVLSALFRVLNEGTIEYKGKTYEINLDLFVAIDNKPVVRLLLKQDAHRPEDIIDHDSNLRPLLDRLMGMFIVVKKLELAESRRTNKQRALEKDPKPVEIDYEQIKQLQDLLPRVVIPPEIDQAHSEFHDLFGEYSAKQEAKSLEEYAQALDRGSLSVPFPYLRFRENSDRFEKTMTRALAGIVALKYILSGGTRKLEATFDDLRDLRKFYIRYPIGVESMKDLDQLIKDTHDVQNKQSLTYAKWDLEHADGILSDIEKRMKSKLSPEDQLLIAEKPKSRAELLRKIENLQRSLRIAQSQLPKISSTTTVRELTEVNAAGCDYAEHQLRNALEESIHAFQNWKGG